MSFTREELAKFCHTLEEAGDVRARWVRWHVDNFGENQAKLPKEWPKRERLIKAWFGTDVHDIEWSQGLPQRSRLWLDWSGLPDPLAPWVRFLQALDMDGPPYIFEDHSKCVLRAPFERLEDLTLRHAILDLEDCRALVESPWFGRLKRLSLSKTELPGSGLDLISSSLPKSLCHLGLSTLPKTEQALNVPLGLRSVQLLLRDISAAEWQSLSRAPLENLEVCGSDIELQAGVFEQGFDHLQTLDIRGCQQEMLLLSSLVESELPRLRELVLSTELAERHVARELITKLENREIAVVES